MRERGVCYVAIAGESKRNRYAKMGGKQVATDAGSNDGVLRISGGVLPRGAGDISEEFPGFKEGDLVGVQGCSPNPSTAPALHCWLRIATAFFRTLGALQAGGLCHPRAIPTGSFGASRTFEPLRSFRV